jgi:hypothetical protein
LKPAIGIAETLFMWLEEILRQEQYTNHLLFFGGTSAFRFVLSIYLLPTAGTNHNFSAVFVFETLWTKGWEWQIFFVCQATIRWVYVGFVASRFLSKRPTAAKFKY